MADVKITALTAISANPVNPATFPMPMVDLLDTSMAASGTTKKVTVNQILGAGGTATLASATITGALTVDTTTLVVNPSGYADRVGIGTATPGYDLEIAGAVRSSLAIRGNFAGGTDIAHLRFVNANGSVVGDIFSQNTNGGASDSAYLSFNTTSSGTSAERYRIDATGVATWSVAGTTAMTLNSAGLGIGAVPSAWGTYKALQVSNASLWGAANNTYVGANYYFDGSSRNYIANGFASEYSQVSGVHAWFNAPSGIAGVAFGFTQAMTLDASGNLLVGKTATNSLTVGNEVRANGEIFSNQASTGNTASTYHVYSTGAAAYRFYVGLGGTVFATNTVISAISDARFKENIQDIDVGLNAILALKPRKFDWKTGKGKDIKGDRGFIAQEFETVFPNLIDEWKDPAPEGEAPYKSVRADLIPVLVKAIQELTARVQTLETR